MSEYRSDIIFELTIADFESVLGRELTDDEIDICMAKFSIENWADDVDIFLSSRGIINDE